MKESLAVVGGLLSFLSIIPYVLDILKGKTRPNVVSWFTWSLITAIVTVAAFSSHEYRTAFLTLMGTLATLTVVLLGLKNGIKKYTRFDIICQGLALGGLVLWQLTSVAATAIIVCIITDFIGGLPTLRHAFLKPKEETWQTFAISSFSALLTVISLTEFNAVSLGFPIYLVLMNGLIGAIVIYRRLLINRRLALR